MLFWETFKWWTEYRLKVDLRHTWSGLESDWNQTGIRLEANWKRTGRRLEAKTDSEVFLISDLEVLISLHFLLNIHGPPCKGYCLMTMVSHPRPTLPLTARESPSSSSITCVRTFPLGSPSLIVSEEAISYIMAILKCQKISIGNCEFFNLMIWKTISHLDITFSFDKS